ncbi:MAG: peptidylprolyl isomerase [Candidatus Omnitrophica bacterium]|nr:peptidylprolyl isomerase [Candidatus Omnitrophota bacterium]
MRLLITIILILSLSGVTGCAKRAKEDVAAVVNGKEITVSMVEEKIEKLPPQYQTFAAQHRKEIVNEMVIEQLIYEEAKKRKLQKEGDVKDLIEEATRKVLISKVIEDEAKKGIPVSDDDVKTYYEQNRERYVVPEMVRASHILNSTEEEAKRAKDELDAGIDFAEVARKYSKDLTKERGGDLGYFKKGQMIPEFEKVAFSLEINQISDVVKTRFGYHIIKVDDRKPATYRDFEEVKENIRTQLTRNSQREAFDEFTSKLKKSAYIQVNDGLFESEEPVGPSPEPENPEEASTEEASTEEASTEGAN